MKKLVLIAIVSLCCGCTTINNPCLCGTNNSVKSDQDQRPTTPITTEVQGIPGL